MDRLLRRVFPTRPGLGLTLIVVMLVLAVATIARAQYTYIGRGFAVEGIWKSIGSNPDGKSCYYSRGEDKFNENKNEFKMYNWGHQHHSLCTVQKSPSANCPDIPTGDICGGVLDQDHIGGK